MEDALVVAGMWTVADRDAAARAGAIELGGEAVGALEVKTERVDSELESQPARRTSIEPERSRAADADPSRAQPQQIPSDQAADADQQESVNASTASVWIDGPIRTSARKNSKWLSRRPAQRALKAGMAGLMAELDVLLHPGSIPQDAEFYIEWDLERGGYHDLRWFVALHVPGDSDSDSPPAAKRQKKAAGQVKEVVGLLAVTQEHSKHPGDPAGLLCNLFVTAAHRGRGVASRLVGRHSSHLSSLSLAQDEMF
jgi:ribosomal protein S18 acetylase RimI-like enzyme